ncbi:inositol-3-phosphate synthase [Micromonospora sp. M12]
MVGLGGAVATTAIAGVELLRLGMTDMSGLPLAHRTDLVAYESMVFGGWDLAPDDLAKAAHLHRVVEPAHLETVAGPMGQILPWPAVADPAYCRNATGANVVPIGPLRDRVAHLRADLGRFRSEQGVERVVVVNLASTEARPDPASPVLRSLEGSRPGWTPTIRPSRPVCSTRTRRSWRVVPTSTSRPAWAPRCRRCWSWPSGRAYRSPARTARRVER